MRHTENKYIQAGYRYERANNPHAALKYAQRIRAMLQDETTEDQTQAQHLVEQGRREARQ